MTLPAAIEPTPTNIGQVIRAQREALRMSQKQLALATGVTSRTIGSYERGVIDPPAGFVLAAGRALGVRFVDDGEGRYQALDAAPESAPAPQVVVIVATTAEAAEAAMREALDRAGVPRAE